MAGWARWVGALGVATAVACGGEEPTVADEPGPAGERSDPTLVRTLTPDGEIFEAEIGRADRLPSGFPEDVPVYGDARPLSSLASPEHGTVVNLRSADPPEKLFAWYRDHYARQGWTIEHADEARGRSTLVARKGNRVSSVVIQGVPGATQALLTVTEDR